MRKQDVPRYEKSDRGQMRALIGRIWNLRGQARGDADNLRETLMTLDAHCEALTDMAYEAMKELEAIERARSEVAKP